MFLGVSDQQKEQWKKQLTELRDSIGKFSILTSMTFPSSLNSYERMILHELATQVSGVK